MTICFLVLEEVKVVLVWWKRKPDLFEVYTSSCGGLTFWGLGMVSQYVELQTQTVPSLSYFRLWHCWVVENSIQKLVCVDLWVDLPFKKNRKSKMGNNILR